MTYVTYQIFQVDLIAARASYLMVLNIASVGFASFASLLHQEQQDRESENRVWVVWSILLWAFLGFAPVGRKLGLDARLRMFWLAAHVLRWRAHLEPSRTILC